MTLSRRLLSLPLLATASVLFLTACGSGGEYPVRSHVSGSFSVRAEVDSTGDHAGFRVTVLGQRDGDVDTLGTAVTGRDGAFAFEVRAPEAGIYPISVERNGAELALGEFVAVDGDSVTVTGIFPLGSRRLRIVSTENAAWMAYRNAKTQHNHAMAELVGSRDYTAADLRQVISQTSTVLWNIQGTYAGTIGGNLAKAESVIMLEGWNDSLVVARYPEISPANASIVEVARAARRSLARLQGGEAALDLLRTVHDAAPAERKPGLMAELVIAFADSNRATEAVETATELRRLYPDSPWATWAARATYDLENLQPGMDAPAFAFVDQEGQELNSSNQLGRFVILEFFDPLEPLFQREIAARDNIAGKIDPRLFGYISISVQTDQAINEAFLDGNDHPGHFVMDTAGLDQQVVRDFNVNIIPTRFLIDPDGRIVAKYTGPAIGDLESDLVAIISSFNDIAERMSVR
jgi:peroxiredoxin